MNALNLTYPAPQQGQHLLVETDYETLKIWADGLPYGKMDVALEHVIDKLAKLNRTNISIKDRCQLMALFHTPFRVIHDYYYDSHYFREKRKQNDTIKVPKALRLFSKEMSYSFKLIACELSKKRTILSKNKQLAPVFNWALQYLELTLLDHYIAYEHAPNYLWREIHQLYAYAEHKKFHLLSLPIDKEDFCLATIADTYKRILLISECSPYHLEKGQLWDIFCYLKHWAILADIQTQVEQPNQPQCFVIDLGCDHKPVYAEDDNNEIKNNTRFLSTHALVQKIKLQIEAVTNYRQAPQPGFHESVKIQVVQKLLEEMAHRWDRKTERKHPRKKLHAQVDFIWGLASIRQVLSENDPLSQSADLPNIGGDEAEPFLALQAINCRWETINASKNGLCIRHSHKDLPNMEVGQLIIYRQYIEGKPSKRWDLGIIRWLEESTNTGTDIGIELIKGHPQPVLLQTNMNQNNKTQGLQSALLVTGDEIHGMFSPTIISPPKTFYEGRVMQLSIGTETQRIKAQLKATETGHMTRFFYQILEDEEEKINESTDPATRTNITEDMDIILDEDLD